MAQGTAQLCDLRHSPMLIPVLLLKNFPSEFGFLKPQRSAMVLIGIEPSRRSCFARSSCTAWISRRIDFPVVFRNRISACRLEQRKHFRTWLDESPEQAFLRMNSNASATEESKCGNRRVELRRMTARGPKVNLRESSEGNLPLICPARMIAASSPPRRKSGRTEVNVGIVCSHMSWTSSTPITAISSGILMFEKDAAVRISDAVASLAANRAQGLGSSERKDLNFR